MVELELEAQREYANPFTDVQVRAAFTSPTGETHTIAGFHDGQGTWRVRFRPAESGEWRYAVTSEPNDPGLVAEGTEQVEAQAKPRFLQATPGENWGFTYSDGEPCFILGDTLYNLFGAAHCGVDVERLLRRRAEQGFNIFRARCQVCPQHPGSPPNVWQTRSLWPWGGTREEPQLDRFNVEYCQTVDRVMRLAEELDVGFEMIMEAWGFEFPFNDRESFTEELEKVWMGYLIARYDAFSSVYVWTLMNEYEYFADGKWDYAPEADKWAMPRARWVKSVAPHGHVVAVHNGPGMPPFAERFAEDPEAIDAIMYQTWGTTKEDDAWLAAGIEDAIRTSLDGWPGSAAFMEYGYERSEDTDCLPGGHRFLTVEHTRRGAWRGACSGLGVANGFDYTWGPQMVVDRDQPGVAQLALVKRFFTEVVRFERLRPTPHLVASSSKTGSGEKPLCLADDDRRQIVTYMPVGGTVRLELPPGRDCVALWFDPRTGHTRAAITSEDGGFTAPTGTGEHPDDWVLVVES